MSKIRKAVVGRHNGRPTAETVAAYLPHNYKITATTKDQIVIEGQDDAGWSLDKYVIPRLGSGLISAREVTEDTSYPHQPDFEKLRIAARPHNDQADEPVVLTAACVCGDEQEQWSVNVYGPAWRTNKPALLGSRAKR